MRGYKVTGLGIGRAFNTVLHGWRHLETSSWDDAAQPALFPSVQKLAKLISEIVQRYPAGEAHKFPFSSGFSELKESLSPHPSFHGCFTLALDFFWGDSSSTKGRFRILLLPLLKIHFCPHLMTTRIYSKWAQRSYLDMFTFFPPGWNAGQQ